MERTAAEEGKPTNSAQAPHPDVPPLGNAGASPLSQASSSSGQSEWPEPPTEAAVAPLTLPVTSTPSQAEDPKPSHETTVNLPATRATPVSDHADAPACPPTVAVDSIAPQDTPATDHQPATVNPPDTLPTTALSTFTDSGTSHVHNPLQSTVLSIDQRVTSGDPDTSAEAEGHPRTRQVDGAAPDDGVTPENGSIDTSLIPLTEMPGLMAQRVEPPLPALAFWRRSIILGSIVAALGGLTVWEHNTIPDRPARPVITVATPAPNATPLDTGMADALRKVRTALVAHDTVTLAGMVDPDGLVVGPYAGGIPESGYPIPEAKSFLSNVMTDARLVTPGWRTDPRGRIFLLVDGWRTRPLSLSPNSTLELTPLAAMVMQVRNGVWTIRWFLIDATGILTQQARNVTWQGVP
jgi:hypothetical protein